MPVIDATNATHPLRTICETWLSKIKLSKKQRHERFGTYAVEAMKFYDTVDSLFWNEESVYGKQGFLSKDSGGYLPRFRMTVNKLAECVALYGPTLYYQNPSVLCSLNESPDYSPESLGFSQQDEMGMQQYAMLMQQYGADRAMKTTHASIFQTISNRLQYKTDKKTQSRRAIQEAIVSGCSYLYTEMYTPRGGGVRYPCSKYLSWEDVGFDPDANYEEDIQWIFVECLHPVNLVEREYGLPEGTIRGNVKSMESQADEESNPRDRNKKRKEGGSYDLLRYYKIYSKNGFGDKLRSKTKSDLDFSAFGDYCFLVVASGIPFPLNIPTWDIIGETQKPLEELVQQAAWPIPFWQDEPMSNGWPISKLYFTEKSKSIYPISMVKPVIGQMRFLNWIMSFLADKTAASCTTYLGRAKAAGVEIQNQLQSGLSPFTIVEISDIFGKSINDMVSFLQAPNFSIDIWKMASEVALAIDKGLGTTELLYGITETQMRSAKEAEVKQGNLQIRPEDMAQRVEEWVSCSCLKEIEAARWLWTGQDVAQVVDPLAAKIWDEQIMTQDVDAVVRDFTFRIEAGSAKKPNKQGKVNQLREIGAVIAPVLQQFAQNGVPGPWNAYVADLGRAMDVDTSAYVVQPPPPPEQQGPSPEEQKLMLEQAATQQKMASDQQQMQIDAAKAQMDLQAQSMQMAMDQQSGEQELSQEKEMFSLEKKLMAAKTAAARKNGSARSRSVR